jgi:Skp family chaperone for outer membrane proteins
MKRVLLALALTLGFATTSVAQQKVGHINVDELLAVMPETQSAQAEIQKYQGQLEGDAQAMQEEYMTKMQNAQANVDTWTQLRLAEGARRARSNGSAHHGVQPECSARTSAQADGSHVAYHREGTRSSK